MQRCSARWPVIQGRTAPCELMATSSHPKPGPRPRLRAVKTKYANVLALGMGLGASARNHLAMERAALGLRQRLFMVTWQYLIPPEMGCLCLPLVLNAHPRLVVARMCFQELPTARVASNLMCAAQCEA